MTSLIQLGLDTHDMVEPTDPDTSQKHNRPIQLRVLAGDYYSSRFYQLLAQAGEVDWVKKLSGAICEVNRLKMNFYMMVQHLKLSAEDYLRHMVQIRSTLFLPFSQLIDGVQKTLWPDVLKQFTSCELIVEELDRLKRPSHFRQSWAYWYLLQVCTDAEQDAIKRMELEKVKKLIHEHQIPSKLCDMLDKHIRHLGELMVHIESDKLSTELNRLVDSFKHLLQSPKVLEEI